MNDDKYENPTITLATTFFNPVGEANTYAPFVSAKQKICKNTRVQVSG